MPPTAITVPVEQDSGAARLEAAEQRLPETLDPESLRKYFTYYVKRRGRGARQASMSGR